MRSLRLTFVAALAATLIPTLIEASPIVINFDSLSDSTILGSQFPGVTFSNAIVLTAGISLNEIDFPPKSGANVASDNGGPMRIDFATPVSDVAGFFTYAEALTLKAFSPSGIVLGSVSSKFDANFASSAHPSPNEFLELALSGISYVTFTADPLGGSFTLDDLTFTAAATPTTVPEPSTFALVTVGAAAFRRFRRW